MKLIITDIKDPALRIEGEHKIIKPDAMVKHCIGCFGCLSLYVLGVTKGHLVSSEFRGWKVASEVYDELRTEKNCHT